ncbi:RNA polymerase sigma-70 factor [Chitinophaga oryzae]|uniref:RNA polymerase sigma-70 factor n=1 Tax=Chitinophaga oryzae TaxID=2725414 RepID=A0AAE6ZD25_9BACT|nr:RNA polymerase sigma-70 factor [Chitinophaga oryzae]QJB30394.1 RNA polymerase sigma-70 factor [Chitinophaga oryzae]QJB36904.1 RNA polymerase sigma-70 factor [Chitinophaga oryzae]
MSDQHNKYTEDAFIQQLAAGDQQVFRQLFDWHYKALCYFAGSIVSHTHAAEDLVQEAFSKLWDKRGDFQSTASIKAFLFISTRNACLNYLKQQNRLTEREQEFLYHQDGQTAPVAAGFDPLLAETELLQHLYAAIEQLPAQCKRVFKMGYLEGRKNEEIATALNISYNTVRTQKLRAIKLLRSSVLKKQVLPLLPLYLTLLRYYDYKG